MPSEELAKRYEEVEGSYAVEVDDDVLGRAHYQAYAGRFLSGDIQPTHAADTLPVTRSLIRHDSDAVANAIIKLYEYSRDARK